MDDGVTLEFPNRSFPVTWISGYVHITGTILQGKTDEEEKQRFSTVSMNTSTTTWIWAPLCQTLMGRYIHLITGVAATCISAQQDK